jgi:hypothetical protein
MTSTSSKKAVDNQSTAGTTPGNAPTIRSTVLRTLQSNKIPDPRPTQKTSEFHFKVASKDDIPTLVGHRRQM